MRKSADEKARSRERILNVAAVRIREAGLEGPSVGAVMREAEMTHGGFYKHFDSREDLVREAVDRALTGGNATIGRLLDQADDPLAAFVDFYLSAEHVTDPGHGCAVAALTGEMPHAEENVRDAYRRQIERYLAMLERLLGDRAQAHVALSALIGAVSVSRALGRPADYGPILEDVRSALKAASTSGTS